MNPEVSRILAAVKAELNLSRKDARKLVSRYGNTADRSALPAWMAALYDIRDDTADGWGGAR